MGSRESASVETFAETSAGVVFAARETGGEVVGSGRAMPVREARMEDWMGSSRREGEMSSGAVWVLRVFVAGWGRVEEDSVRDFQARSWSCNLMTVLAEEESGCDQKAYRCISISRSLIRSVICAFRGLGCLVMLLDADSGALNQFDISDFEAKSSRISCCICRAASCQLVFV